MLFFPTSRAALPTVRPQDDCTYTYSLDRGAPISIDNSDSSSATPSTTSGTRLAVTVTLTSSLLADTDTATFSLQATLDGSPVASLTSGTTSVQFRVDASPVWLSTAVNSGAGVSNGARVAYDPVAKVKEVTVAR